ncbi:MAG TPA: SPOR domain-containing protein [Fibrobacteria bacterium]|nr:SPOR domain-containing protein [Fibrobacteria bacterium]
MPIASVAIAGLFAAFSPTQVKEDLDAHPWRPAPSSPVVAAPAAPESTRSVPAPEPAAVPAAAGTWQIQLAALSSFEAAKSEQKRLEKVLGAGKLEISSEGPVNRLRYGSYPTKEAAEDALEALRAKGVDGFPVRKP